MLPVNYKTSNLHYESCSFHWKIILVTKKYSVYVAWCSNLTCTISTMHHKIETPETRQACTPWAAVWHLMSGWSQWEERCSDTAVGWTQSQGNFRELLGQNREVLDPVGVYVVVVYGLHQPTSAWLSDCAAHIFLCFPKEGKLMIFGAACHWG